MANPLQRLGKAKIRFGSSLLETMPGATLDLGGVARTTQTGANAVLGFTETPKPSRLEATVSLARGTSAKDLNLDDVNFTFEGDTGQVWAVRNAWSVETQSIDSGAGTTRVILEGLPAEEVL